MTRVKICGDKLKASSHANSCIYNLTSVSKRISCLDRINTQRIVTNMNESYALWINSCSTEHIMLQDQQAETLDSFCYLDSIATSNRCADMTVNETFALLQSVWRS